MRMKSNGLFLNCVMTVALTAMTSAILAEAPKVEVDLTKLPAASTQKVEFEKDILPILKKSCFECHGPDMQMGGFRMDKRDAAIKGGENGIMIVPGKSAESKMIHYVGRLVKDMEMPPGEPLKKETIALLRAWVDQGAKW